MPRKKPIPAFQTIRIVSKHAQRLIQTAQSRVKKGKNTQKQTSDSNKHHDEAGEHLVVSLSIGSVVKSALAILVIALFVLFCYQIRSTLLIFLLSIFLAVVIDPGVTFLERWGMPRGFCIFIVYIIALALLLFLLFSLIPIIAEQVQEMSKILAEKIDAFLADPVLRIPFLSAEMNQTLTAVLKEFLADVYTGGALQNMEQFGQDLSNAATGSVVFVVGIAGSVVQFVVSFVLVLVLCFFFQLQKESILRWARVFLPYRMRRYAEEKADAIHTKLAQWIRGQIMLSLSIGILVFIALKALGVEYAITLAVLAFFCEFIPVIGPIIAAVPAVFIALSQFEFLWALGIAVTYYGIQWCENNLLVPLIMQRAVGLSPIAIIMAMLIGVSFPETIHPILGVLLAVPVATILSIFVQDYRDWRNTNGK